MILVTGAGGTVGSGLIRELGSRDLPFRAAFHSPDKVSKAEDAGLDAVLIDYLKPDTLAAACSRMQAVFLLGTGANQVEGETNLIRAAKSAGVERVVKLSAWGADSGEHYFGRIHRQVEIELGRSGLKCTLLRPTGFMQNFINIMGPSIRALGAYYAPAGDAKVAHIDAADIARVALETLVSTEHAGKIYELSGPRPISYAEAAAIISQAIGKPVTYHDVSEEQALQSMKKAGTSDTYAQATVELFRYYRAGGSNRTTDWVRKITGREPTTFEAFVKNNVNSFR